MKVTVMTYNIHHGKGKDRRLDLQRIADVIAHSGADIIGLNEVDNRLSRRSGFVDQLAWLSNQLNMHASFGPAFTRPSPKDVFPRQFGNAILSRYPIVTETNHTFLSTKISMAESRAYLRAEIAVAERLLKIFVTHLSLHPFTQRKQLEAICQIVKEEREPTVWMGDWNMRPGTRAWRKITTYLQDAANIKSFSVGETFPSHRPRYRFDYIFVSSHFHVETAEVVRICPDASDHLPLKAVLHL